MFDILENYQNNGHFFLSEDKSLEKVCNAPKTASGVYVIYALKGGKIELVYIGCSGKVLSNGQIKHRNGGLFDRIVNGKQFNDSRKKSWAAQVKKEKIEALDIYWYETINNEIGDIPTYVEAVCMQRYFEIYGRLPRWNEAF